MDIETHERMAMLFIVIIVIGIIGNIWNMYVFGKRKMRSSSTFRFLFYLSLIDMLVLINCATDALFTYGFNIELRTMSNFACRFHTFLAYYLTHMSSVILMVVNIERVFAVRNKNFYSIFFKKLMNFIKKEGKKTDKNNETKQRMATNLLPTRNIETTSVIHRVKRCFNLNRVESIIIIILTSLAIVNIHFLIFLNITKRLHSSSNETNSSIFFTNISSIEIEALKNISYESYQELYDKLNDTIIIQVCYPSPESIYFSFLNSLWMYIDISTYSLIPFIVMAICSINILIELKRRSINLFSKYKLNENFKTKRKRKNNQTLALLIATNLYFVLCSFPYSISYNVFNDVTNHEPNFTQSLIHLLAYSNNAFNFVFYALFSEKYRHFAANIFSRKKNNLANEFTSRLRRASDLNQTNRRESIFQCNNNNFSKLDEEKKEESFALMTRSKYLVSEFSVKGNSDSAIMRI